MTEQLEQAADSLEWDSSTGEVFEDYTFIDDTVTTGIDLEALAAGAAESVRAAINNRSNNTERSQQQQNFMLGVSNLGHCKQYAKYMLEQVPFSDERDKTPAFFGSIAGAAIEEQLKLEHPGWNIQGEGFFRLPSGGGIDGHWDIVIPDSEGVSWEEWQANSKAIAEQEALRDVGEDWEYIEPVYMQGVWDLKSKDKLAVIKKMGPSRQQIFQIHAYTSAAIDAGLLDPSKPIVIMDVYFDRSGHELVPHGVAHLYNPDVIHFIDEWVNDVIYAVKHQQDAEREMPRDWCWNWCEYATHCRGLDTDVSGLIRDPEKRAAVEAYREGLELVKEGEAKKKAAKPILEGTNGSTGQYNVRYVWVNPSEYQVARKGYFKLTVTPVPKPKPKKRAPKKKADA